MGKKGVLSIEDDGLYDTVKSGAFLGFAPTTMRNSRSTGKLAGVSAPPFIKMGSAVRYKGASLKSWRNQFAEQISTGGAA